MGMREVPSDVGYGSNAAAVADQWRRAERERYAKAGVNTGKLLAAAERWLRQSPEFVGADGHVCPHAVMVTLRLREEYRNSDVKVTRSMVRRAWVRFLSAPGWAWYVAEFLPGFPFENDATEEAA
ncbi:MAG TPA: hypothetical protein VFT50_11525 [Baekduia sp.]|nr:hypothetical protein [Baekduia sp.]